jgi:hypothetical protein
MRGNAMQYYERLRFHMAAEDILIPAIYQWQSTTTCHQLSPALFGLQHPILIKPRYSLHDDEKLRDGKN